LQLVGGALIAGSAAYLVAMTQPTLARKVGGGGVAFAAAGLGAAYALDVRNIRALSAQQR
jgi:hypothetical protein